MIQQDEVIAIGTLRRPHGTHGEIQCQMDNEYWDHADAEFLIVLRDHILVPFRVIDWRGKGADTLIFTLRGIETEQQAAQLTGSTAYMLRQDLSEEEATDITWQQLNGYHIIDTDQGDLGNITDVDESTINTLITLTDGRLIPLHEDFIQAIDTEKHTITITLPFIL